MRRAVCVGGCTFERDYALRFRLAAQDGFAKFDQPCTPEPLQRGGIDAELGSGKEWDRAAFLLHLRKERVLFRVGLA